MPIDYHDLQGILVALEMAVGLMMRLVFVVFVLKYLYLHHHRLVLQAKIVLWNDLLDI